MNSECTVPTPAGRDDNYYSVVVGNNMNSAVPENLHEELEFRLLKWSVAWRHIALEDQ